MAPEVIILGTIGLDDIETPFGRVQGVAFRFFTLRAACALRLSGWVKNLPDGTVEAFAQGEENVLGRFESELMKGPASANVTDLKMFDEIVDSEIVDFQIRY